MTKKDFYQIKNAIERSYEDVCRNSANAFPKDVQDQHKAALQSFVGTLASELADEIEVYNKRFDRAQFRRLIMGAIYK